MAWCPIHISAMSAERGENRDGSPSRHGIEKHGMVSRLSVIQTPAMVSDHHLDKLRPNGKGRQLRVRADPSERAAFERAARMSGLTLSAWIRMAGREMAARQLSNAGEKIPWS